MKYYTLDNDSVGIFRHLLPPTGVTLDEDTYLIGAAEFNEDHKFVPMGVIVGKFTNDILMIDWLYVHPQFRRQGIADALMRRFLMAFSRVEDAEGVIIIVDKTDEGIVEFLEKYGFEDIPIKGFGQYTCRLSDCNIRVEGNEAASIVRLCDVSNRQLTRFNEELYENEAASEGITPPIVRENYSENSAVYIKDNKIQAALLLNETSDYVEVKWMYVSPAAKVGAILLIRSVMNNLKQDYPNDTDIYIGIISDTVDGIVAGIFPNAKKSSDAAAYFWQF